MTTNEVIELLEKIRKSLKDRNIRLARLDYLIGQLKPGMRSANQEAYVQGKGIHCPVCDSNDIEGQGVDIDGGTATQPMSCNACGASWTDFYKLDCYIDLEK